jgi:ABC-type bacteriocin/lantibiotic exporter with double-glycine peptidase domain
MSWALRRALAWTLSLFAGTVVLLALWASARGTVSPARLVATVTGVEVLGFEGVVRQRGRADCGAAALAMVLASFDRPVSVDALDDELPIGPGGTSMLALQDAARRRGLDAAGWRMSWAGLSSMSLPAIAFVDGDHFVVVLRADPASVEIADPARGRLRLSRRAFARRWRGEVLAFSPIRKTEEKRR